MSIKKVFITSWNFKKILVENKENEKYIEIEKLRFLPNSYIKFITKYINWIKNQQLQKIRPNEKKWNEWVFEWWNKSVYHSKQDCPRLNSSYDNYRISLDVLRRLRDNNENENEEEIQKMWEEIKIDFRKWVLSNLLSLKDNPDIFYSNMTKIFWVWKFWEEVHSDNTWVQKFYWASLNDIENELNRLIKNRYELVNKTYSRSERIIIQFLWNRVFFFKKEDLQIEWEYKKQDEITFWKKIDNFYEFDNKIKSYKNKNHRKILEKYGYGEIIKLIYSYDDNNIQKIKNLLIFYINSKYNPDLSFDENILKDLWFEECSECNKL